MLFSRFFHVVGVILGLHALICSGSSLAKLQKRDSRRWAPPSSLVVRQRGTRRGEYPTISAAIAALGSGSAPKSIFLYPGTYPERLHITYPGKLTIYGWTLDASSYSSNVVIITAGVTADEAGNNDKSATLRVHKDDFALYNVDVVNTYGNAKSHLQAVALSAFGVRQGYYACRIIGYQDTLFANEGVQFYGKSLISGAVDFIFGQRAVAWFDGCTLTPRGEGCITANGRDSDQNPSHYVFNKCWVVSDGAAPGASHLGRPWQDHARVTFQQTYLSDAIAPIGWDVWSPDEPRNEHVSFVESGSTGPGAPKWKGGVLLRARFSSQSTTLLPISQILGSDWVRWVDRNYLA